MLLGATSRFQFVVSHSNSLAGAPQTCARSLLSRAVVTGLPGISACSRGCRLVRRRAREAGGGGALELRRTARARGHPPFPPLLAASPELTQLFRSPSGVVSYRPEGADGERHVSLMQEPAAAGALSKPAVFLTRGDSAAAAAASAATRLRPPLGAGLKGPERDWQRSPELQCLRPARPF